MCYHCSQSPTGRSHRCAWTVTRPCSLSKPCSRKSVGRGLGVGLVWYRLDLLPMLCASPIEVSSLARHAGFCLHIVGCFSTSFCPCGKPAAPKLWRLRCGCSPIFCRFANVRTSFTWYMRLRSSTKVLVMTHQTVVTYITLFYLLCSSAHVHVERRLRCLHVVHSRPVHGLRKVYSSIIIAALVTGCLLDTQSSCVFQTRSSTLVCA